jgi:hypothetical protein
MNIGKYVKVILNMVLDNPVAKITAANGSDGKDNPFPNFDIKKLPSADYMAKFFGESLAYVIPVSKGIRSHSVIYYGNNK